MVKTVKPLTAVRRLNTPGAQIFKLPPRRCTRAFHPGI